VFINYIYRCLLNGFSAAEKKNPNQDGQASHTCAGWEYLLIYVSFNQK